MLVLSSIRKLDFNDAVYALVRLIPTGKVLGYGHVATLLGYPRRARHVGFALGALLPATDVPWWRVIRSDGSIAMQGDPLRGPVQQHKLRAEGVSFRGQKVNMKRCRWEPDVG